MSPVTLVLRPAVTFADVAAALAGWTGWPADRGPWLAGEPIAGSWTDGGTTVAYAANPVLRLRTVTVAGAAAQPVAAQLAETLPLLAADEARVLAGSSDGAVALLGVTAAGLLGDVEALPLLDALGAGDGELAGAARLARQRVAAAALRYGADRVAERRRRHPDRDPLLGLVGPAAARRQLVRWLGVDPPANGARHVALLTAAMADDDWEVRWSGLLGAYRGPGGRDLALAVKRCAPPPDRVDRVVRQVLEAAREVVGARLVGSRPRHPGAAHLADCLDGLPAELDRAFLLVRSLVDPVPEVDEPAPDGFCAVPRVLHWLGSDDPDVAGRPIRAVLPPPGLALAAHPTPEVHVRDVPARLAECAARAGRRVDLPSVDELEMGVRGPDGRRYPWGNGVVPRWREARSPWGLHAPVAQPQWVVRGGELVVAGGLDGRCAGPVGPGDRAAVRVRLGR